MGDYKVIVTTFGEAQKKFFGNLDKVRYEVKNLGMHFKTDNTLLDHDLLVRKIYDRFRKCTHIVMVDQGVTPGLSVPKDERTLVIKRYLGKVNDNDLINSEIFKAFYEDLCIHHEKRIHDRD